MQSFAIAALILQASSIKLNSVENPSEFKNPLTDPIFSSYEDYVDSQNSKTKGILAKCQDGTELKEWVKEGEIEFLANYMKNDLKLPFKNKFGLTHGTRCGKEQEWFMKYIGDEMKVLGTEISPEAKDFPYTVVWDFHNVKAEWKEHTDFVYTNALDHSYNPKYAIGQWMSEVAKDGVLILHWKNGQTHLQPKFQPGEPIEPRTDDASIAPHQKIDIYGGDLDDYQQLIRDAGNFEVVDVVRFPGHKKGFAIFARHIK